MSVYTDYYTALYEGGFPLDLQTALLLGGTWTDITDYTYNRSVPAFTITRGRPDENSQVTPSSLTAQLNNRDGRFTSRNPTGPYYGDLGRNTPVRVSVPAAGTALRLEDDSVSYASASVTGITGDVDVRAEMWLTNWMPCTLASQYTAWALVLNGDGTLGFWFAISGTPYTVNSTMPITPGHIAVRATRAESTGVVTFYTSATIGGSWTQLGETVTGQSGTTTAAGTVSVGYDALVTAENGGYGGANGLFYDVQVYSGIGGTLKAEPAFSSQTAGTSSWSDAQSNSWSTSGTATIDGRSYCYHGEMSSLPVAWDPSGHDIWVPFTSGGILRRLQQGSAPNLSAMMRGVQSLLSAWDVIAYWPCEDASGATQIASGLSGGTPMLLSGLPAFQGTAGSKSADSIFSCSAQLPQVQSSTWIGTVPYNGSANNALMFLVAIPSGGLGFSGTLLTLSYQGFSVDVNYSTSGGGALDLAGGATAGGPTGVNGNAYLVQVYNTSGGGGETIIDTLILGGDQAGIVSASGASSSGPLLGVTVNPAALNLAGTVIGHIWAAADPGNDITNSTPDLSPFLNAWNGETAGNRFARICTENGVQARVYGPPDTTPAMGVQQIDTVMNILQSCEDADRGLIFEPPDSHSVGYRTLASMCNQSPAITLDYSLAEVGDQENSPVSLQSVDDDQYTRNDITLTRGSGSVSGSSVQVTLNDGSAMSLTGIGDYATTLTVNVEADTQLADIAGWMVHVGADDDERYPAVVTGLHRLVILAAGLGYTIENVRDGDYVEIINPPSWLPPGPIRQIVAGVTETLTSFLFHVSWNAIPESPYETIVLDDEILGRLDTDGSTLHSSATSGATTLSVSTTNSASPLWTTSAGDFPFDINIGGEQITVGAVSGSSSPQTFSSLTRSVNGVVKAQSAGADVRLFTPTILALI